MQHATPAARQPRPAAAVLPPSLFSALSRHLLLIGLALALGMHAWVAQAQAPARAATANYAIAPGTLDQVLNRFAATAGFPLVIDASQTAGKTSRGLSGAYTIAQGLAAILAGSGLEAVELPSGGYALRKLAVVPVPVPAAKPSAPPTITEGDFRLPVVVVHGNVEEDVLEQRMSLSAAKIIVDRSEIEEFGDLSMGEVIRRMPSISFGGPPGENNDARIRGLAKEYTQILIDGQPIPGRDFSIDQIPAHLVERLEIIRTTTANMDNQGIAGTVNIILRRPADQRSMGWHSSIGTMPDAPGSGLFGSVGLSLGDSASEGDLRYQFDGVVQRRNGVRTKDRKDYANGGPTITNREQDYEYRVHDEVGLSSRLTWRLNATDEFRLDPRYLYSSEDKARDRLKSASLSQAEHMDQVKTRQYLGLNGQWQRKTAADARQTLGFNLQGTNTETDKTERRGSAGQPFESLPVFVSGNHDEAKETGFSVRGSSKQRVAKIHAIDVGFDAGTTDWELDKRAWKLVSQADAVNTWFRVEEAKLAVYAQDEILIGESHVLTPGLRVEGVKTRSTNNQAADTTEYDIQPSPSLHWLTNLSSQVNWRASVTRSIRRPKYEDLAGLTETKSGTPANPDVTGNPELKPETAWGYETSLERIFAEKRGVTSVNLFYRRITDVIESTIVQDPASGRYQQMPINNDKASTWGIEFDGSYRFDISASHAVIARGNFSWMDSKVVDRMTKQERPINDQPQSILNLGLDYEYRPWKLKLGAHFNQVGKLQKVDAVGTSVRTQRQEPSRYLDLSAAFPLSADFSMLISALNVLEAEKIRPRTTVNPAGNVTLFEQEDERSSRAFQIRIQGRF
ncbi:MAG: TonB-dependent receptor [Moraxellaceae bacterium]|nr:TonB-dependent receptor [Moraxellaceae bacterium]